MIHLMTSLHSQYLPDHICITSTQPKAKMVTNPVAILNFRVINSLLTYFLPKHMAADPRMHGNSGC